MKDSDMRLLVRSVCAILLYSYQSPKTSTSDNHYLFTQALVSHVASASQFVGMNDFLEIIGEIECEMFHYVYNEFGDDRTGMMFAKSALKRRVQVLGLTHWNTLSSIRVVVISFLNLGNLPEAEKLFKDLSDIRKSFIGAKHELTLQSTVDLARCYIEASQYDAAENLPVPTLKTMREITGEESLEVIGAEERLAFLWTRRMKFSKSESIYHEVLRKQERLLDGSDSRILDVKHGLACLYRNWGKYSEAEKTSK